VHSDANHPVCAGCRRLFATPADLDRHRYAMVDGLCSARATTGMIGRHPEPVMAASSVAGAGAFSRQVPPGHTAAKAKLQAAAPTPTASTPATRQQMAASNMKPSAALHFSSKAPAPPVFSDPVNADANANADANDTAWHDDDNPGHFAAATPARSGFQTTGTATFTPCRSKVLWTTPTRSGFGNTTSIFPSGRKVPSPGEVSGNWWVCTSSFHLRTSLCVD
jgi:hypothetical protein